MRVVVSRCYLVQVVDSEGNELASDYIFCDRSEALKAGKEMKDDLLEKMAEEKPAQ